LPLRLRTARIPLTALHSTIRTEAAVTVVTVVTDIEETGTSEMATEMDTEEIEISETVTETDIEEIEISETATETDIEEIAAVIKTLPLYRQREHDKNACIISC
jgi:hypothetical protein